MKFVDKIIDKTKKNSNHLFAFAALAGLGATAVFVAKETPYFMDRISEANTLGEKIKIGCKAYWPAITAGLATAACIVGLDISSLKRLERATDALNTLKKTNNFISEEKEAYEKKVKEKNPELDHEVRKEVGAEQTGGMPLPVQLYCFSWQGNDVWFEDTELNVLNAKYIYNCKIRDKDRASVNDFLYLLGQNSLEDGGMFGFNKNGSEFGFADGADFIDKDKVTADGRKYTEITFYDEPYCSFMDPSDDCPPYFRETPEVPYLEEKLPFD